MLRAHIGNSSSFDVRAKTDVLPGIQLYVRCNAECEKHKYICTWNERIGYDIRMRCTILSAISNQETILINLKPDFQATYSFSVKEDRKQLLQRVYESTLRT